MKLNKKMEGSIEQILERQHAWTQQMFAQQQQFFAEILSRQSSSPVMSVTSNNIAVPKFQQFDEDSNDFDTYKTQLEEHFKAYAVDDNDRKRSFFLSWIGDNSYRLLQKLVGKNGLVNLTYSDLVSKLDSHYKSKVHIIKSRYEFYKRAKREGESYKQWVTELRGMARECKFVCKREVCGCDFSDELIRDIIILYTPDESVKTAALHKDEPTLEEVLQVAETFEATQKTVKSIKPNEACDNDVFMVKQDSRNQKYDSKKQQQNYKNEKKSSRQWPSCVGCFKSHDKSNCKYLKAQCFFCKKIGHIATVCRRKSRSKNVINSVEEENVVESDSSMEENATIFACDAIDNIISRSGNKMVICVKINNQDMKFQFDTGAMRSVIGLESYKLLKSPILKSTSVKLFGYGNAQIPVLGSIESCSNSKSIKERSFTNDTPRPLGDCSYEANK
ncbi:hypothetical protein CVS40_11291 [Lucilia cuprina]|nr:hypothetical protein CVS40_11291 [Lucilia cuprina]